MLRYVLNNAAHFSIDQLGLFDGACAYWGGGGPGSIPGGDMSYPTVVKGKKMKVT